MPEWKNRIIGHGEEAPDQLLANPRNWRIHPEAQQKALAGLLDQVGWVQDVIVNQRTGHVVDGHLRVALAIGRQEAAIPVVYVDLSEHEEQVVLASLDPLGAMAATDTEMLRGLLDDVAIDSDDLRAALEQLSPTQEKAGLTDPDAVPDAPAEPTAKPGDLWLLGDHRLFCGDSTNAEHVGRLLDGATPKLMVTDPPYGVLLDQGWRDEIGINRLGKAQSDRIANDDRADWAEAWNLSPSSIAYVWAAGGAHQLETGASLQAAGYELRQQIIWAKTMATLSRSAYHYQHEPCWYAVRKGATAGWVGGHKQTTVWEAASPKHIMGGSAEAKEDHPTQKPIEVMARPIRNHDSREVYEPFSGSGTTIIAAEQLGRRCYAMEIEPRYVDVAVQRWEEFTGRKAERG